MIYIVNCDNSYYLMYFAINKELRNKKYGSEVLKQLNKKYDIIFLSIEKPKDTISERRKHFYLRNGFYETNKYCIECNVEYELMCSNQNYNITDEIHRRRYNNMTKSKIVGFCINKIF